MQNSLDNNPLDDGKPSAMVDGNHAIVWSRLRKTSGLGLEIVF